MNFGQISIIVSFLSALGASYFFFLDRKSSSPSTAQGNLAYRLFLLSVIADAIASVTLLVLLLTHQFQYAYVAHYSSNTLPVAYLLSAFWAGQEGTFLLWSLYVAVMGLIFYRMTRPRDALAMACVSAFFAFLLLLLIAKSPFEISQTVPRDGEGLNPLLQNFWMVIHPPILFLGYAAAVLPFALALSALWRKNNEAWDFSGFAWTLFSAGALGAGIIIGGFWAYEVLGWGGYWGWDPVENSSLVPWLTLLALVHGLVVQRSRGALVRTNALLALFSFILVLYATFLTRSGVLADFSVHSFVDLGINAYLIGVLVAATVIGLGVFAIRFRTIHAPKMDLSHVNRELTLTLSMAVLLLGALFTFVGMSSPLLTGLFGKASQVDTSFYGKVNLPVAIGIAFLLGVAPFLGWKEETYQGLVKRYSMSLPLTALSCIIAYVAGVTGWILLLFVGTAAFGLISNVIIVFRQYRSGWTTIGGPIAHIGVALMFIGIVGSGSFDETTRLVLVTGKPQSAFGYDLTFTGVPDQTAERPKITINVADGKRTYVASPSLYFSTYNQSIIREPDIKIFPMKDLYISPMELRAADPSQAGNHPVLEIAKGETKEILGYKVTFERYQMDQHGESGSMSVGAVLHISSGTRSCDIIPQLAINDRGERMSEPVQLPDSLSPGKSPFIALNAINVEEQKVFLAFAGLDQKETTAPSQELLVEVSIKPLMMVLWTGVVLIIAGTVIAWRRRTISAE
ncbi:MAG TPA: cytochrome c biogenesis protein CcsA [Bacteroidota bacterium]|nr:cytochrome c biogenesis protein CcsA [Bacteroidota bacterium]